MSKRFDIGKIIASTEVHECMTSNHAFRDFVNVSLERYFTGDWGDSDPVLAKDNDKTVEEGGSILAYYIYDPIKNIKIAINTLEDRSTTFVVIDGHYQTKGEI